MHVKLFKKYDGKFLKETPQPTEAAKKEEQNPLLKTYWTSLVSLMLCVTMFFGTTVAWFSDDVTVENNQIDSGKLSVGLAFMKKGDLDFTPLGSVNPQASIFSDDVKWAPGYTAVRELKVTNKGDLNMRYRFSFLKPNADWNEDMAKCFEVCVKPGSFPASLPGSYSEIKAGNSGWTPVKNLSGEVATLHDIVTQNLTVFSGSLSADAENNGQSFLIALHMKEETPPTLAEQTLSVGAHLIAYQSGNSDDLGASFDTLVFVQNETELRDAWNSSSVIVLGSDITLDSALTVPAGGTVQLDLHGNKLTITDQEPLAVNGKLVVSDSTKIALNDPQGSLNASDGIQINTGGTLILNGGKLGMVVPNGGTLTMNGGIIEDSHNAIWSNGGTLNLNYGLIRVTDENGNSVYGESGATVVNVENTFHFQTGSSAEAKYNHKPEATLTVKDPTE